MMHTEIEAKFLDIRPDLLRELIKKNGGLLVHPERLMRRKNFDYDDSRLEKIGGWIRLRDEGDVVTLAYKQLVDRTIEGTKEISVVVGDFDTASELLLAVGLRLKSYQETKRERWELGGIEVTIDTWPWIPTFVELEGSDEKSLQTVAAKLQLDWSCALHGSVESAYQEYYDVTEEEIDGWQNITFIPVPQRLAEKKRNRAGI
ncbi:MAG: hypothetical protein A3B30_02795 [Candidatus Komeilibacteria bacterium RIFCSPLOWO2_01_FULL_52_15]|uniref:CYTH domain-containing protein n=2 Tax=Candidatus Komeiliibacteriota TaxID=1817908 RepID=A0A1G2BND6_9BACT|nr:MAG: hypothetical protein A2677_02120 [Candidatus Komeilibacteria bacterium RIFCSPHIGHO2_01_FULL_52_14]OGY90663.1 MAG: hypothetical protein A3B30_02795 [Candidatus Komeilibacteria bacterium RIFCSPLOWO2_01_FULL_52_15]